jgi:hypothetical protein
MEVVLEETLDTAVETRLLEEIKEDSRFSFP